MKSIVLLLSSCASWYLEISVLGPMWRSSQIEGWNDNEKKSGNWNCSCFYTHSTNKAARKFRCLLSTLIRAWRRGEKRIPELLASNEALSLFYWRELPWLLNPELVWQAKKFSTVCVIQQITMNHHFLSLFTFLCVPPRTPRRKGRMKM